MTHSGPGDGHQGITERGLGLVGTRDTAGLTVLVSRGFGRSVAWGTE
jgi:hypothetical protein